MMNNNFGQPTAGGAGGGGAYQNRSLNNPYQQNGNKNGPGVGQDFY
jgi:hypothetical protein